MQEHFVHFARDASAGDTCGLNLKFPFSIPDVCVRPEYELCLSFFLRTIVS